MVYLIGQIFMWLVLAAGLGGLVGWLAAGVASERRMVDAEGKWRLRLDRADMQVRGLREELQVLRSDPSSARPGGAPAAAGGADGEGGEDDEAHRRRLAELAAASRARIQRAEQEAEDARGEVGELRGALQSMRSEFDDLVNQLQQARRELDLRDRQLADLRNQFDRNERAGADNGAGAGPEAVIMPAVRSSQGGGHDGASSPRRRGSTQVSTALPDDMILPEQPDDADDLKLIYGIGPTLEGRLNALGIYKFRQIAAWDDDMIERVADNLHAFPDRIRYDNWVEGAREQHLRKYGERI